MDKYKKQETQNGHVFNTTTVNYFLQKLFQYTIQRVNFVLRYSKIKIIQIWMRNLRVHFLAPLNNSASIKSVHVKMDPVGKGMTVSISSSFVF